MSIRFDEEATSLDPAFPPGRRLVVVGSTSFWGKDSPELCQGMAIRLAGIADLIAITGGMPGVGETFGQSFADERRCLGLPEQLFHVLPKGFRACDRGVTLFAGLDYEERREVLGRLGQVYLVIEGGPGTEHEVRVARGRGAAVIPVGRSGGHAGEVYPRVERSPGAGSPDWELLQDLGAPLDAVISAVQRLVEASLSSAGRTNRCSRPGPLVRLFEWFNRLRRPRRLN
jgi:hypothetical protein